MFKVLGEATEARRGLTDSSKWRRAKCFTGLCLMRRVGRAKAAPISSSRCTDSDIALPRGKNFTTAVPLIPDRVDTAEGTFKLTL
jgi:hypothetical protein